MKIKIRNVLIVLIAFVLGGVCIYAVSSIADTKYSENNNSKSVKNKKEEQNKKDAVEEDSTVENKKEETSAKIKNNTESDNISNNQNNGSVKKNKEDNNQNNNQSNTSNENNSTSSVNSNATNDNNTIAATKEYYCTNGYELNGTQCEYKLQAGDALQRYYCESGTLNGSKCESTSTTVFNAYTAAVQEQCQSLYGSGHYNSCLCTKSGGTYDSNKDLCYKTQGFSTNAQLEYYCTGDLILEGDQCVKYYSLDAFYKYTCPKGYTLVVDKCKK